MAVLVLGEVTDGELNMEATAKTVTAAKIIGDVTVLCAGASAAAAGDAAAKIDGVSKVLVAEDASLGHRLAEPTAALIVSLAGGYDHNCARKGDGTVWCWGENDGGELGNGSNSQSNIPYASWARRLIFFSRAYVLSMPNRPSAGLVVMTIHIPKRCSARLNSRRERLT